MPTFSIIIPCYKVEKYIRECLDSVLAQTETSWEAICVDDGSPDNTGKILDEYASKDRRIKVIHQPNAGLSAARNAALAVATGDWLLYLDSDDMLSPWALETYVKMMTKFPQADILRAGMTTSTDGTWKWGRADGEIIGCDVHDRITMYGLNGYFQRMIYKRVVHGDIRFVGMSWCEERPYVAKCLARAEFVTDTPIVAYGFRVREESITHSSMSEAEAIGFVDVGEEVVRILSSSGKIFEPKALRMLINNWFEVSARNIVRGTNGTIRWLALRHLSRSIPNARVLGSHTLWHKFVMMICWLIPLGITSYVLGYLPDLLKRKGLHR